MGVLSNLRAVILVMDMNRFDTSLLNVDVDRCQVCVLKSMMQCNAPSPTARLTSVTSAAFVRCLSCSFTRSESTFLESFSPAVANAFVSLRTVFLASFNDARIDSAVDVLTNGI